MLKLFWCSVCSSVLCLVIWWVLCRLWCVVGSSGCFSFRLVVLISLVLVMIVVCCMWLSSLWILFG